ncbi:MAG: hypothetical protein KBB55_00655 [Candidatus Buchananbacteria bacterium]|nr:hypothetical protein [Candidatus Buchananbacteria bacterium]
MSILDQVRKNQFRDSIANFNPVETLNTLFAHLSQKERDVIERRFGLSERERQTLEEIGQHYGITRERVRQIESLSIKKLKQLEALRTEIKEAERVVADLLEQYGGVMEEQFFLEHLLNYLNTHPRSENALLFLAEYIFSENVAKVKQDKHFNPIWQVGSADVDPIKEVINEMVAIIERRGEPMPLAELLTEFKSSEYYKQNRERIIAATTFLEASEEDIDKILESYLRASRRIKQDFFENWGLVSWGSVRPKKINDKIYIVLKKAGKPLHFVDIASQINEMKFDEKIAYPPTVHNELILDNKYVLVGRGTYALREWGYTPGNVAQVIEEVLRENGPLSKADIITKVLERRNVKQSTIYLSLMNNKKITRSADGKYALVV